MNLLGSLRELVSWFFSHLFAALFKLKAQNVIFWLVAPSLAAKALLNSQIDERIDNLWKIHTNRVDRGTCLAFI
jgi:hypothetical protein